MTEMVKLQNNLFDLKLFWINLSHKYKFDTNRVNL